MTLFSRFKPRFSWPFGGHDPRGQRLIGTTFSGEPLWAPKGHSLLLAANGSGKTTAGLMPSLFSLVARAVRPAILVMDGKNGEIAAQCAPMLAAYGVSVAVVDDMGVRPELPNRVALDPLGALLAAKDSASVFAAEKITHALIPDPPGGDAKNQFWRDGPRGLVEFAAESLKSRTPYLATPGGLWAMLANLELLKQATELEAKNASGRLQTLGRNVEAMMGTEYFPQHREAALKALNIFAVGSELHDAGAGAKATHAGLVKGRRVIFVIGPQEYMPRMGAYFALHLMGFLDALYREAGPLAILNDEFTNTPLKSFVEALTTIRGFGGEAHNIAQSRSEMVRKFGERECQTIEDNAIVKQWFGFSSFEEAERVSKAMGQVVAIESSLNVDLNEGDKRGLSNSFGRQAQMSAAELMAMPADEQLVHVKGVGFFRAKKLRQNQIAPFCHDLAPNPLEGGMLPPKPVLKLKMKLKMKKEAARDPHQKTPPFAFDRALSGHVAVADRAAHSARVGAIWTAFLEQVGQPASRRLGRRN
jgi:type IV secretion system protein VirD4